MKQKVMLQPIELPVEELGDLAQVIPGHEPKLRISIPRIPVSELDLERPIIPVCKPVLQGNEARYVMDCLNTGWISSAGKYTPLFEQAFSHKVGCNYGIACVSGTTALHLILAALGLGPGDERGALSRSGGPVPTGTVFALRFVTHQP